MRALNVTVGENGRMIIPAAFRKQLDMRYAQYFPHLQ
jgi:bifunctional DNA-binding transcriptional regulator/antitoxin component of YhaV-PrlF toxin-antitoxin module